MFNLLHPVRKLLRRWFRTPGAQVDVWEAHASLLHLEEITAREIAAYEAECARLSYTATERREHPMKESAEWLQANESVAETMAYISAAQEMRVRSAVAAGEVPAEVAVLLDRG